jgi:uncharacterized membrane protein
MVGKTADIVDNPKLYIHGDNGVYYSYFYYFLLIQVIKLTYPKRRVNRFTLWCTTGVLVLILLLVSSFIDCPPSPGVEVIGIVKVSF